MSGTYAGLGVALWTYQRYAGRGAPLPGCQPASLPLPLVPPQRQHRHGGHHAGDVRPLPLDSRSKL